MSVARPCALWIVAALLWSCAPSALSPDEVTRAYWEAIASGDLQMAAAHASRDSLELLSQASSRSPIENVMIGETLMNESAAIVRTSMSTRESEVELKIVFDTHLVLEDDRWKVDVGATREDATRATFAAGMNLIGEAVGQGIQEFGKALELGAEGIRDAIRDALEGFDGAHLDPDDLDEDV